MESREIAFLILGMIVGSTYNPESFWLSVVAKSVVGLIGIIIILATSDWRSSK